MRPTFKSKVGGRSTRGQKKVHCAFCNSRLYLLPHATFPADIVSHSACLLLPSLHYFGSILGGLDLIPFGQAHDPRMKERTYTLI